VTAAQPAASAKPGPGGVYAKVIRRSRIWWSVRVYVVAFFGEDESGRYEVPFRWWARSKARRAVARCVRRRELRARYKGDDYRLP
jgi:hypothetical protein